MYQYQIEHVQKVTSGDSLHLVVDLGFHISTTVSVSLYGVETPEYGTFDRQSGMDKGQAARDFTVEWFKTHPQPWILHTNKDRRDGFQRWQGTIMDAEGKSLADDLIEKGYGTNDYDSF